MIYLTSFFRVKELPDGVRAYSAAVYQPKGHTLEKVAWTDIRNDRGEWTRPRNFLSSDRPLAEYRESLYAIYYDRIDEARRWLDSLDGQPAALCCWCPFDRAAQRQLREFGSFTCHTAVIGEFLEELGQRVWYDTDRLRMSVLTQQ